MGERDRFVLWKTNKELFFERIKTVLCSPMNGSSNVSKQLFLHHPPPHPLILKMLLVVALFIITFLVNSLPCNWWINSLWIFKRPSFYKVLEHFFPCTRALSNFWKVLEQVSWPIVIILAEPLIIRLILPDFNVYIAQTNPVFCRCYCFFSICCNHSQNIWEKL